VSPEKLALSRNDTVLWWSFNDRKAFAIEEVAGGGDSPSRSRNAVGGG
jgi:hypothetical protein